MTSKELCRVMTVLIEWNKKPLNMRQIDEILDRDIDTDDRKQLIRSLEELFKVLDLVKVFVSLGLSLPKFDDDDKDDNDQINEGLKIKKDLFRWRD